MLVPSRRFVERASELTGKRREPCEHITELVHLFVTGALANGAGELAELFCEPGHRGVDAAGARRVRRRYAP